MMNETLFTYKGIIEAGWSSRGKSFGDLAAEGVLTKHYESSFGCDPDCFSIVWEVIAPFTVIVTDTGKVYRTGDRIVWEK